jgi:hypothetical protein
MRGHRRLFLTASLAALAAGLVVWVSAAFGASIVQTLVWSVSGKLPHHGSAPATLKVAEKTKMDDGSVPPPMKTAVVEFDKAGKVDTKGLPTCKPAKLQNTDAQAARKACKKAIVGTGKADAKIVFPGQSPVDAPAPVTVFNGTPIHGHPNFLIHAYTTVPVPTTFVVPGELTKLHGKYGTKLTLKVPKIAGGSGSLVLFKVKVNKTWKFKGKKHSYISGACPSSHKLLIQGKFSYKGAPSETAKDTASC